MLPVISFLLVDNLLNAYKRRVEEVDSIIKGTVLYLAKRGSGRMISSFVAIRTWMESIGSKSVSLLLSPRPS